MSTPRRKVPGGPAGVKGISLFVVPRRHVHADGSLGDRNDVRCVGLNHKMGWRGTVNTVLALGIPTGIAFASLSKILTLGWPIVSEPLPAYNGGQMWFAVYFGAATWPLTDNPYLLVLICGLTVTAAGLIGGLIGVTSVALTFPRREASSHRD